MSTKNAFPSDFAERFQVRMPEGLRDRIRDAAEANSRSMNSEIVARLEKSFPNGPALSGSIDPQVILDLMREIAALREQLKERT